MKKLLQNIALGLLLAFTALPFISCGHDPVFYGIIHDVVPESALVNGNITSIARCSVNSQEYLFLSNGGKLLYKPLDSSKHGEWKSDNIKLPFKIHQYNYYAKSNGSIGHTGELVHRILADENNIYIFTASFKEDTQYGVVMPKAFHLYTKALDSIFDDDVDWVDIADTHDYFENFSLNVKETKVELDFFFFYTNSPKAENRKAFLCVKDSDDFKYYELKGAADPLDCTASITAANKVQVYSNTTKINSAFYLGSDLYFSDSLFVITDETKDSPASYACLAGMKSDYYPSSDLYYFKAGDSEPEKITSASSPIASLAITADSLIIGKGSYAETYTTTGGLERLVITNNKPEAETKGFTNNAQYQITSSYIVMTLLCADPSQNEADATLYASVSYRGTSTSSSASYNNIGLWSYYPSRGNWNRE